MTCEAAVDRDTERLNLYTDIVQCPRQCPGITNDRRQGLIPRSFYWRSSDGAQVSLLVVSKNPASSPDWERELFARTAPNDLASAYLQSAADVFDGVRSVTSNYHSNLIRRVAAVLGVEPTPEAVFRHAAMTALAKCQSVGAKTAKIPHITFETCAEAHLFREIAMLRPVYLLALGNEAFEFLTESSVAARHGLQVGKLWHPSWSNMPGGEAAYFERELPALRHQYEACLRSAGRQQTSSLQEVHEEAV